MNIVQQKRIRMPIVFDSDESYEYYDSYESQESENDSNINNQKEIHYKPNKTFIRKPPLNRSIPLYPAQNATIFRPRSNSLDAKDSSTPGHKNNDLNEQQQIILQNDRSIFEIEQTEFVEPQTYALVVHKDSKFFKKTKTFTLLDKGNETYKAKIDSYSNKRVVVSNNILMYIQKNRTEFIIKANNKHENLLAKICFSIPFSYEECKRKTSIRFTNFKGGMLPNKIVSLPTVDDAVFNDHYYIKSKRNVAFAIINNSKPVLAARQIKNNIMEIDTILNLPSDILFGIALALYIGKNETSASSIDTENVQKFQVLNLQRLMRNT